MLTTEQKITEPPCSFHSLPVEDADSLLIYLLRDRASEVLASLGNPGSLAQRAEAAGVPVLVRPRQGSGWGNVPQGFSPQAVELAQLHSKP